jgi:hypothetical protein
MGNYGVHKAGVVSIQSVQTTGMPKNAAYSTGVTRWLRRAKAARRALQFTA